MSTLTVAILSFGLVGVMVARARAVETAFVSRNLKVARLLAEGLLAEIQAGLHEDLLDGAGGDFTEANYAVSVALFILVYIAVTGLSLPGATILTLAGGFLFGSLAAQE